MGKPVDRNDDRLITEGIDYLGYGQIAKAVMKDKRLSIGAKALYSYICSYAGAGDIAWPGRELICKDLGVNKDTYAKYLKELKIIGYIRVTQKLDNGRFGGNTYVIVKTPTSDETLSKKSYTDEPRPKKPDTEKPDMEQSYTKQPDSIFTDSNNNSSINNNNIFKKDLIDRKIDRAPEQKLTTEIVNPDPTVLIKTWAAKWNVSEDVIRNRLFALQEQLEKGTVIDDIESYVRTSVENYLKSQAVLNHIRPPR